MALTTYAELKTSLANWMERSTDVAYVAEVDTFIDLFEAAANRKLNTYRREATATIVTDSSGVATLPTDFRTVVSVVSADTPSLTLTQRDWQALQNLNPLSTAGTPCDYAISGTSLKVSPVYAGNFTITYEQSIPALDDSTTSNWLLDLAPDAYLAGCLSAGHAFLEDEQRAALWEGKANSILDEIYQQDVVAQYGNAPLVIQGAT